MATPKIQSKNVYFQMDNTVGVTKDFQIMDTVQRILEQNGFTVHRVVNNRGRGPNAALIYDYIIRHNIQNSIVFNLYNGVDPSCIREAVQQDKDDGKGWWYSRRALKPKGNVAVLGWFYNACDFVNPGGSCYNSVRASETSGRLYNPKQYMDDNGILYLLEKSDTTGEAIAKSFVDLVNKNMGITPASSANTNTSTSVPNTDSNQNKTLSEQTIQETYTAPYYQQILTVKTDENGSYTIPLDLPYAGKYKIDTNFAGSKNYQAYTDYSEITNYGGQIFQPELLQKTITNKYTDGTTETKTDGDATGKKHTTTKTTTKTYKDNTVSDTKETTTSSDKVITVNPSEKNTVVSPSSVKPASSNTANTQLYDPYTTIIPTKNGVPNVEVMTHLEKRFEMVDLTKTYTINKVDYIEVFDRDSKSLQLNNYLESKYTAFYDDTKTKYFVLERERWNAIEESIYYYRVKEDGKKNYRWISNYPFPEQIVVDFPNKRTYIKDKDVWIPWKAEKCIYHFCGDHQDLGRDCGPTAASVATQVLHHQQTEADMENIIRADGRGGSGPEEIRSALKSKGFYAEILYTRAKALQWLHDNKPLVFHVTDHYNTWVDVLEDNSLVLAANSAGSYNSPSTGWSAPWRSPWGGPGVLVAMNWTMTDEEKSRINRFYQSMGGTWPRWPNTNETLRQYRNKIV